MVECAGVGALERRWICICDSIIAQWHLDKFTVSPPNCVDLEMVDELQDADRIEWVSLKAVGTMSAELGKARATESLIEPSACSTHNVHQAVFDEAEKRSGAVAQDSVWRVMFEAREGKVEGGLTLEKLRA